MVKSLLITLSDIEDHCRNLFD